MNGRAGPLVLAGIAALALGLLAGLFWAERGPEPPQLSEHATWLEPPKLLAPFELVDHRNQVFGPEALQGRWSFVFFGYTHCPDVCPTTLGLLNTVAKHLAAETPPPQFVFVSVDPERDTPEQLASFVGYFNPAFIGVTGTPEALSAFTRQLGVLSLKVEQDGAGGGYLVDHTAAVFLFDPAGRLVALFSPPLDATGMTEDFRALARYYEAVS